MSVNPYFLYILKCIDGTYYTGICTDLERRVEEHNGASQKGAKYTQSRRPVEVVFSISNIENRKLASKGEWYLKRLRREKKEALIHGDEAILKALKDVMSA